MSTGGKKVRGVETRIQEIRHAIFTEVAKMAYDTKSPAVKTVEEIPYHIIPGEVGSFRSDVFMHRYQIIWNLQISQRRIIRHH